MSATPERWLELAVRSGSSQDGGLVADGLMALGGRATEERDGWQLTHLPAPDDEEAFQEQARAFLTAHTGLDDLELRTRIQDHENWAETWKKGLEPRRITSRIVVTPSWMDPEAGPDDRVIVIDPGMAFGTAEHGTTRGCLRLLDAAVTPGERLLDVGAGSGILSIAAALLGAASVTAIEGDELATETLQENLRANGVSERVDVLVAWADPAGLRDLGPVDGIVANIETGILTPLLPGFAAALRAGGWLIMSGILDVQWEGLVAAAAAGGFQLAETDADGEWRTGLFRL